MGSGGPGESGALSPSPADPEEEWEAVVRTRVGQPVPEDRGMVRVTFWGKEVTSMPRFHSGTERVQGGAESDFPPSVY